jgi:hypothetical protein
MITLKSVYKHFIYLVIIFILACLLFRSCSNQTKSAKIYNANLRAATSKTETYKNKANELSYKNASFIASEKELKTLNDSLYTALKKEKGKVSFITQFKPVYISKPLELTSDLKLLGPNHYGLFFKDSTKNKYIEGISRFKLDTTGNLINIKADGTSILRNEFSFELTVGFTENDKQYDIFVTPSNPEVVIKNIKGTIIPKNIPNIVQKKKKFGIGPQFGIGVNQNFEKSIYIGIGISYNLIKF